jgi:hypothetical protein|tara:strand:+ start:103 stop:747 length:645 start_codon:yes stop_codon:yes gene_type:complete
MAYTFTTLKQAIQDYTENTETTFVNNLSRFILQAEERMYRSISIPDLRKVVTASLVASQRFLSKPSDFLNTYSIAVIQSDNSYKFLLEKDPSFIREAYPTTATTGVPEYYANHSSTEFILAPTPSSTLTVQLHYAYDPESITVASSGTSWLGDNAEAALLYASLIEAYIFMKGDADVLQMYENKYQDSISQLSNLVEGRLKRDSYRDGEPRIEM